ncbi:hypothetical protein N7451_002979 [Penicillium sp. IBT 35674x]|nr:hypothetical protein N7451_002979 [Penicillium sp. IBT 35674x]
MSGAYKTSRGFSHGKAQRLLAQNGKSDFYKTGAQNPTAHAEWIKCLWKKPGSRNPTAHAESHCLR